MLRQQIIDIASSQNNIKESPSGSNKQKYGEWYGANGVKWCAIFVSWVFDQAGAPLGKIETSKGYHYCQGGYHYWKEKGELTKEPEMGDIVLYDWKGDGHCDHTGIFDSWKDNNQTRFYAWEGNTEFGNDSDGGKVMRRERNIGLVKAFVKPRVLGGPAITDLAGTLKVGDTGSNVSYIQRLLWDMKYTVQVDGIFGPGTEAAVKKFQADAFLEPTGVVTAAVRGAMQEELVIKKQTDQKASTASYLQKGNSGAAVKELQEGLNVAIAGLQLKADGVFGDQTFEALKKFQMDKGLPTDGIAGPQTFTALSVNV
jgi:peptidoglycan hydrolase-like protein with peptidoglycan-binding domain